MNALLRSHRAFMDIAARERKNHASISHGLAHGGVEGLPTGFKELHLNL